MQLTPEIVTLPSRTFVGLEAPFISALSPRANNLQVIPKLWADFDRRFPEMKPLDPSWAYGLCDRPESLAKTAADPDTVLYLAAVECSADAAVPQGMVKWTSPAGTFAKFTHRGRIEKIGEAMALIHGKWLPSSGYTRAQGPEIEQMGPKFSPQSDGSVLEILIPIRQ